MYERIKYAAPATKTLRPIDNHKLEPNGLKIYKTIPIENEEIKGLPTDETRSKLTLFLAKYTATTEETDIKAADKAIPL